MGQYWYPVNLTKHEYIHPHRLGSGLKLWEQLATHPGTAAALVVLCAAMPEVRGGGDLDLEENWHGPERKDTTSAEVMPEEYLEVAKRTIGRWAGDRVALIGDYAADDDIADYPIPASHIFGLCYHEHEDGLHEDEPLFLDISEDVRRILEHELGGFFSQNPSGSFEWNGDGDL